jgi:dienelactone hydrolase
MSLLRRVLPLAFTLLILLPALATAGGVQPLFDLASPAGGPFPSDRFTVLDFTQNTLLRVNLPKPDCAVRVSDCADLDVINTLDGFNLQPRLSIPFSGPIDVTSVSSDTVFLVRLGDALGGHGGEVIGINQVVWDPGTNTLHAESDEFLDQHTRYLLVVTTGVKDAQGQPIGRDAFEDALEGHRGLHRADLGLSLYRLALEIALAHAHVPRHRIAAASLFTTQSATAVLEKIRHHIKHSQPAAATMLGTFPLSNLVAIQWRRQVGTNLSANTSFSTSFLPTVALNVFPGSVGAVAFGRFSSPDWETAERFIPPIGTRTGVPAVQGTNDLYFNLFVPAGTAPAGGWPVAIFGHGFTDSKQGAPILVASTFAAHGIATIAINVVGHGGGPLGTLTIIPATGLPVTIPAGGRGIDQDGNGTIDSTEGSSTAPPRGIISSRDGLRQTVADLMQLVRVIQTGGIPGLSRERIYYAGQSFGGIYGVKFLALEDSVRAGVPNVPGGPTIEIARLSPSFRGLVTLALAGRTPPLLNVFPIVPPLLGFNENSPLRNLPPVVNAVPGAMAIQEVIDNTEWVSQSGNPVAYAPHLRKSPLHGIDPPPVIIQFAKGDQTVPNPTASAIFRAGDLVDRSTFFRNDLVRAAIPTAPANPHTFLTNIGTAAGALAIAAQQQIAIFFESDGTVIVDPDGAAGPFFEVPIAGPLPEGLNF